MQISVDLSGTPLIIEVIKDLFQFDFIRSGKLGKKYPNIV
jgi:hypothetical protein